MEAYNYKTVLSAGNTGISLVAAALDALASRDGRYVIPDPPLEFGPTS